MNRVVAYGLLMPALAAGAAAQIDLAKGARAVASSHKSGTTKAARAVDGVVADSSRWVSANERGDKQLTLELAAPATLRSAHIYSGYGDGGAIRDFRLLSRQGGRFRAIAGTTVRGNRAQELVVQFERPVETDAVRLVVEDRGHARVRELALFAEADVPIGTAVERARGPQRYQLVAGRHHIAVNQVGFARTAPKRATCPLSPDGSAFQVRRRGGGEALFEGVVRDGIADFGAFAPADAGHEYELVVAGAGLDEAVSDAFTIRQRLWSEVFWQPAIDFLIDVRSVIGTHPSAYGGCPWRDGTYYTFEVPSLVLAIDADLERLQAMPRQIDIARERERVLADDFRFDAKNPRSEGVMATVREYFTGFDPVADDAPDAVKMVHWGLGYYLLHPETHDPSNDPAGKAVHGQTVEQFAYFLWVYPRIAQWVHKDFFNDSLAFVEKHWRSSGCFDIPKWWQPKSWSAPVLKGDDWSIPNLHPYKGRHALGHSIQPNLMMYEVAKRTGRRNANDYRDAAIRQARFLIEKIDWSDPRATKGHRTSEFKTICGLAWMLEHHADIAPKGLRKCIREWARIAISRSDNYWDFRRYDTDGDWTIPKLNEVGNLCGFPAAALAAAWVVQDERLARRLRELAQSHVDNLFGRNPQFAAAPHDPQKGFPLVERGWPKGHRPNVCARLELCRGSISASPGSEMYPLNPNGKFRHPEGWSVYGAAWLVSLAHYAKDAQRARRR